MDFEVWADEVNNIQMYSSLKDNIINFFKYFSEKDNHSFIRITNEKIIKALNNINHYRTLTICLDAEFQTTIVGQNSKFITYENFFGHEVGRFLRELGMLFFVKDNDNFWFYIGHIFVNFNNLVNYGFKEIDTRLVESKFATVTDRTFQNMVQDEKIFRLDSIIDDLDNEKLFNNINKFNKTVDDIIWDLKDNFIFNNFLREETKQNIIQRLNYLKSKNNFKEVQKELKFIKRPLSKVQYEIYGRYLLDDYYDIFSRLNNMYWNDRLVRDRLKIIENKETLFFSLLSKLSEETIYLIKGMMDFQAIKNMYRLIFNTNKEKIRLENYYDIETFNGISNQLFGSSQLEETYKNLIKTKIYRKYAKNLFDEILKKIGKKAHNPVVDSLFSIVVAVVMNLGLNSFFDKELNLTGGSLKNKNIKYLEKYMRYKNEYLNLKTY